MDAVGPNRPVHAPGRVLTEERPEKDDGPFLAQEGALLDALARTIGEVLERDRLDRLLRKTIASLEEAVIVVEPGEEGYRILDANPAAERIFGYSREELVDTEIDFSLLFSDRPAYERFQADCDAALESSEVYHGSVSMRREDGTRFEAEQTVTVLDANKGLEGERVFAVRDVSGRRRAEERFRVLSREIVDHIYVLGADLGVLYSTPSVERFIGIEQEEFEKLQGTDLLELVHPEDRERVLGSMMESLDAPGSTRTSQYRVTRPDGEIRHVESIVRNLVEDPIIGGLVVTTRDVTERVELEERMREGRKLEAVGRLSGGIAHDFNNILTVIRSQTDLLLLEELDRDAFASELEIIQASVDRAAALTNQLLAYSRDQLLEPRTIDLSVVVRSTGHLVDRIIGEDIAVEYDLPEELPPIEVDPGQLEQAVLNLAVNARDAMPRGGTLTLSAYREEEIRPQSAGDATTEEDGGRVVRTILRVSDTGTGMSADTLSRVFEPFYTTKAKGKGTGLGLSMVYGFVEQSGGSIHVESRIGEGSNFYLGFPASSGIPTTSSPPGAVAGTEVGPPELRGALLLVEDDPAVQRATKRVLETGGLNVLAVGDAESGLELLEGGRAFDIVLTDFVLPRMNGRDLVRRIRASAPELPVVVMSGYAEGPAGQELDLPEGIEFLQKPFTRDELMERVRKALSHETL